MLHKRVRSAGDRREGVLECPAACVFSRLGLLFAVAVLPLVLWGLLPVLSDGSPQSRAASLGSKIDQKRKAIEQKKGRERVLSTTVTRYSHKIGALQCDITVLQRKQVRDPERPRRQARGALAHPGGAAPGAHPPRPAAGAAGRGARSRWPAASSSSTRPTSPTS